MAETEAPKVAVIVPARNEAENLAELLPEIEAALRGTPHEIVLVDDGSDDGTPGVITRLAAAGMAVRRVAHARSLGKSAAMMTGVIAARAPLVVTLDGDGQNDPRFIPDLVRHFDDPAVGLVA